MRDFSEMDTVEIIKDVEHYISDGRMGYEEMLKAIKPDSDLIIEGNQPLDTIVEEAKSIFMI